MLLHLLASSKSSSVRRMLPASQLCCTQSRSHTMETPQLGGEFLLRQPEPLARFAELGPGIELARGHGGRLPLHISDITG